MNAFEYMARANTAIALLVLRRDLLIERYTVSRDKIVISYFDDSKQAKVEETFYSLTSLEMLANSTNC